MLFGPRLPKHTIAGRGVFFDSAPKVLLFPHNNTPCRSHSPTTGGFCLLSVLMEQCTSAGVLDQIKYCSCFPNSAGVWNCADSCGAFSDSAGSVPPNRSRSLRFPPDRDQISAEAAAPGRRHAPHTPPSSAREAEQEAARHRMGRYGKYKSRCRRSFPGSPPPPDIPPGKGRYK